MANYQKPKHIKFVEGPNKPKTKTWWVVNKYDDFHLGWVGWFAKWRKYAFFLNQTLCLKKIV